MLYSGDDFRFKNAKSGFEGMDAVMSHVNNNDDSPVHLKYCTLSEYFESVIPHVKEDQLVQETSNLFL